MNIQKIYFCIKLNCLNNCVKIETLFAGFIIRIKTFYLFSDVAIIGRILQRLKSSFLGYFSVKDKKNIYRQWYSEWFPLFKLTTMWSPSTRLILKLSSCAGLLRIFASPLRVFRSSVSNWHREYLLLHTLAIKRAQSFAFWQSMNFNIL